eukprot:TRINITY_DN7794_c0_g1_i1.p2 TRINITY_DN7794_c0_g1~~TRINITY_DN7794_c0_g1_i1.p2  ORF type:complete len:135 (-),score=28.45 TRINITY_DN7794_c0_g1_i1:177-581(-)
MCIRDRVSTQSTGGTNTTMHWREIVGQVYEYAGASSETEERMFGSIRLNSDGTFELTFRRLSDEGFSLTEQRGTVVEDPTLRLQVSKTTWTESFWNGETSGEEEHPMTVSLEVISADTVKVDGNVYALPKQSRL